MCGESSKNTIEQHGLVGIRSSTKELHGERKMSRGAGCRGPAIVIALVAVGLLWGALKCFKGWHYQRSIAQIEYEIDQGLSSLAAKHLGDVLDEYPGSDECSSSWATVKGPAAGLRLQPKPGSRSRRIPPSLFVRSKNRADLALEQGKIAEAEQIILRECDAGRSTGPDPSLLLGPVYYRQGRVKEAMRSVEATWRAHSKSGGTASETAIKQLRLYIHYRSSSIPYDSVRATIELAGRVAPDDDRIWLCKGRLAIATGEYKEASRWLDRCQEMHPEDPAVWDARLEWAMATHRVLVAREALKHLPATEFSPAQVARVTAWFARERGDHESERRSLERLLDLEPTDDVAFDRLIESSTKNGQPEVAVELRRRKAEIGKLQARYRKLYSEAAAVARRRGDGPSRRPTWLPVRSRGLPRHRYRH